MPAQEVMPCLLIGGKTQECRYVSNKEIYCSMIDVKYRNCVNLNEYFLINESGVDLETMYTVYYMSFTYIYAV